MIRYNNKYITEAEAKKSGLHVYRNYNGVLTASREKPSVYQLTGCYQDGLGRWHDINGKYCKAPTIKGESKLPLIIGVVLLIIFVLTFAR
ncbi:hypothetical protein ACJJVG_08875 [Pseudocitrobacter faecalis]|uniref:hypothetical protein n=1 Tax=Pseudocitrobacter faecalis TaxID=1398493 RepID=UPI00389A8C78